MNYELLQKLIDSYIEKYSLMNNQEHHEIYKWTAVSNFQKYWDIDAENFGKMFKKALSESENLVDDNVMQPGRGIDFLCKQGDEWMERVRDAFRDLLAIDNSDYGRRQKKINTFVEEVNAMLDEAGNEEWKYRQNPKAVIMYLAFIEPDDNYMFREGEVKAFANYVRYTGKIGSGKSFSLKSYYKLCEEIVARLQDESDLMEMVAGELEKEAGRTDDNAVTDIDGENHILAFDLIYCAQNYDFYEEQLVTTKKRPASAMKSDEKEQQANVLREKIAGIQASLDEAVRQREQLHLPDLNGQQVTHKKFGTGQVTAQDRHYLTVQFGENVKKFTLPDALIKGFLAAEDPAALKCCEEIAALDIEKERCARELHILELELALIK
ncbi:MAG: hypothetical protein IJI10_11865 [Eubacterium sp.]|nr:hypothetical protein [Eubacterium sp.]